MCQLHLNPIVRKYFNFINTTKLYSCMFLTTIRSAVNSVKVKDSLTMGV